jgi:methanogenic corrinoid protein MtbC1
MTPEPPRPPHNRGSDIGKADSGLNPAPSPAETKATMRQSDRDRASEIDAAAGHLVAAAVDALFRRDPSLHDRYGEHAERLWRNETQARVAHLAEALAADRPALFLENANWSRIAFSAREYRESDLKASLQCLAASMAESPRTEALAKASELVRQAIANLERSGTMPHHEIDQTDPDARLARTYLLKLLERNQREAAQLLFAEIRAGKPIERIYERIVCPALAEVGRMWQVDEIAVADEHFCTAATQVILAQLKLHATANPPCGRSVLATSVGGDLHDVGIRMVADLFEFAGWRAECLGANTPTDEIVTALRGDHGFGKPFDLLAVSGSTSLTVRNIADVIAAIRGEPATCEIPVLVGGTPFRLVPDLWKVVGADGMAATASGAVQAAERLLDGRAKAGSMFGG